MAEEVPGFADALRRAAAHTESMLDTCLPEADGPAGQADLAAAMRYAVLNGGKRLRAFLAIETASLFGSEGSGAERVAAAVE